MSSDKPEESFYGLSFAGQELSFKGPIREIPAQGGDMLDVVKKVLEHDRSVHMAIVPQFGLAIVIKSESDFLGFKLKSAMTKSEAANFITAMIEAGKKVNFIEKYGAIELV